MTISNKARLDGLLEEYKAQPVGDGYIDIIVSRENYRSFAKAIIESRFLIEAISWWEYLESIDAPNTYGMGGPRSRFYPGWFAETCTDVDDVPHSNNALAAVVEIVEGKVLGEYGGEQLSFKETKSLTPAFWLKVDEGWKSRQ
ncbi:hypothetical protein [Alcanivorax sp.]|uniref:hypothetical protein n=1 Tax=Alcanivorax sp. TaxID=1872427 RepID=UPI000C637D08|nr:hypothetical protein [Alcanivorax sp.]MBQ25082.1 hypothetical protein [Alcanivorax sp.]